MKNQKHVFWQALVLALIVFNLGVFLGYKLELSRNDRIAGLYAESEISLLDVKILSELYNIEGLKCETVIQENINFANKVYEEAKLLTKYEDASRITEDIKLQHRKYDLLRTLFWINSIKIKTSCNATFHNLVYFYQYNNPSLEQKAMQNVFSKILGNVKEKYGNNVMLIPIAADNNVSAVNILVENYQIDTLPTILIDEKIKIEQITSEADLEKYLT